MSEKQGFNWGGMLGPIVGAGMGMLMQGENDRRQVKQQGKLNEVNAKTAKDLMDYQNEKQIGMANTLNKKWEVEQLKKAGLSVGMAYGGSGGGVSAVTGGGMPGAGGGSADGAAASSGAMTGMAMAGANLSLLKAQKENIEADTANKLAEVPKKGVETDLATEKWREANRGNETFDKAGGVEEAADTMRAINQSARTANEKQYNDYEAYKAAGFKGYENNDPESPVAKAMRAGMDKAVQEAENVKKDGSLKDKANIIEGFKARLAAQGISPDTPWYAKLIADVATKLGVNPLDWIK